MRLWMAVLVAVAVLAVGGVLLAEQSSQMFRTQQHQNLPAYSGTLVGAALPDKQQEAINNYKNAAARFKCNPATPTTGQEMNGLYTEYSLDVNCASDPELLGGDSKTGIYVDSSSASAWSDTCTQLHCEWMWRANDSSYILIGQGPQAAVEINQNLKKEVMRKFIGQ